MESILSWKLLESHINMKGGRLFFEWRGLYSSPFRETLRRQKKWGGPSSSPSTERSVVHSIPAKVNVLQPCAEGVPSRLGSLLAFCLWEAGGGGEGAPPPQKKITGGGNRLFFLPFFFLLDTPTPRPQGPVALCLLSPLIWPLLLPY